MCASTILIVMFSPLGQRITPSQRESARVSSMLSVPSWSNCRMSAAVNDFVELATLAAAGATGVPEAGLT